MIEYVSFETIKEEIKKLKNQEKNEDEIIDYISKKYEILKSDVKGVFKAIK